jgi:hypothetical protein
MPKPVDTYTIFFSNIIAIDFNREFKRVNAPVTHKYLGAAQKSQQGQKSSQVQLGTEGNVKNLVSRFEQPTKQTGKVKMLVNRIENRNNGNGKHVSSSAKKDFANEMTGKDTVNELKKKFQ